MLTPLGSVLTEAEKDLYALHKPFGFILFGRHCETPDQLRHLCADLRAVAGENVVIGIDQEGGRVARMRAPHWPDCPPAALMDDVEHTYRDIGHMLRAAGITLDFAPCLDVIPDGAQADAIGDRCFSSDPHITAAKGGEACKGLLAAGITPVIKHMPGHGRAKEDSHYHLPIVDAALDDLKQDFIPFQKTASAGLDIAGMTAHVMYPALDKDNPATLSQTIIREIIRGEIGFKGLLFSDDLAMKALDSYGDIVARTQKCLEDGCDIALPCNTDFDQSQAILESV